MPIKGRIIEMPNGVKLRLNNPAKSCEHAKCNNSCTMIELNEEGFGEGQWRNVSYQMKSTIQHHVLQDHGGGIFNTYVIVSIEKVVNPCLWRRYTERKNEIAFEVRNVKEKMLFHGSKSAEDIIKRGFDLDRANDGGMFGPAIYLAQHSSKSNQYAYGFLGGNGCPKHSDKNCYDCPRQMILCRVTLGNVEVLQGAKKRGNPSSGYHSVKGEPSNGGLQYPEYAVYSEDQIYPEYLISYKIATL